MKKKPKAKTKGPKGFLYAIKKRANKSTAWMPDEVLVTLEGEKTGRLLLVCGWSSAVSHTDVPWPIERIESNLPRLEESWAEDYGKSWKLEIRPS
jgi:hypothetical protein